MALTYILECDDSQDNLIIVNQADFDDGSCSNTIKMKTKYGNNTVFKQKIKACEKPEYLNWYEKIGISIYIIGPILIVLGIYLATYGANTFKYIVAFLMFLGGGNILAEILMKEIDNAFSILIILI